MSFYDKIKLMFGWDTRPVSPKASSEPLLADDTQRWDAIVTDQLMPDGDGWAVLNHVRTHWPSVPVVVLSASELDGAQLAVAPATGV